MTSPLESITKGQQEDSARLEWLHAHDAGFGMSGHCVVDETGEKWTSATFVRVPCKYLYEWHCYDGDTWRGAIDTAMAAPACKGEDGDCENSHTIRDPGADHARRRRDELRVASQIEAAVKAEREKWDSVKLIGAQLSNIAYNLSHAGKDRVITEHERKVLAVCASNWDVAIRSRGETNL
jgi:hypothetical protein